MRPGTLRAVSTSLVPSGTLRALVLALGLALAAAPSDAAATRYGGHSYRSHSSSSYRSHSTHRSSHGGSHRSHGKTKRDPEQRRAFMRSHPCPSTGKNHGACPGYVVDHVQALKHGGADAPSNMQWQTTQAAKEKDRWE